jgi:glycosyltransferase involved in cell wall biosynthesis
VCGEGDRLSCGAMRVMLDTTYALRGHSGTAVYLKQLLQALRDEGAEVLEAANERRPAPAGGGLGSARNLALDARWTQIELPRRAWAARADVLHHPLPAFAARAQCPQVVTVHDLAFERLPECFSPAFRLWASRTHRRAARRADAVVCVSQTTRRDALARWGVDPGRIVVAAHGPGQQLRLVAAVRAEHFLYVGDDEPRKNLGLLLDAHARYRAAAAAAGAAPLPLVLAGRVIAHQEGVRCVADPNLPALLHGAAALVHPALHEGFGLTALEAMNAGVPVVAARSPGLAETVGDGGLLVDPYDAAALARVLERVATDPALRAELAQRGRARAAGFSWRASARAHIEAYTLATQR